MGDVLQCTAMHAWLILAESASAHPDGTVSILRAGINRLMADKTPILCRAAIVARIEAEPSERGTHSFSIVCIDVDGKERLPTISATFEIPPQGGQNNIIIGMSAQLPEFGIYVFALSVDKMEQARFVLRAEKIEVQSGHGL